MSRSLQQQTFRRVPLWGSSWLFALMMNLPLLIFTGCGKRVHVEGQISFSEGLSYESVTGCSTPLMSAQQLSWADCHRFKKDFRWTQDHPEFLDTVNQQVPEALRPLTAKINLRLLKKSVGDHFDVLSDSATPRTSGGDPTCYSGQTTSNTLGHFDLSLEEGPNYNPDECNQPGEKVWIDASVTLEFENLLSQMVPTTTTPSVMTAENFVNQTVFFRALWDPFQMRTALRNHPLSAGGVPSEEDPALDLNGPILFERNSALGFFGSRTRYSVPVFRIRKLLAITPDNDGLTGSFSVGNLELLKDRQDDRSPYFRQILTAYQNGIRIYEELKTILDRQSLSDPHWVSIASFFHEIPEMPGIRQMLFFFDRSDVSGSGGGVTFEAPNTEPFMQHMSLVNESSQSTIWTIAHELGHSIHAGFARQSFVYPDYSFSALRQDSQDVLSDYGHAPGQIQDFSVSFVEGVASALGTYLINRCENWNQQRRLWAAHQNLSQRDFYPDNSCDRDPNCNYHQIRYHLKTRRGLTASETSAVWTKRTDLLAQLYSTQNIFAQFHTQGKWVLSNDEERVGELICDLLDQSSDTNHVQTNLSQSFYLPNFTLWVAKILDGTLHDASEYIPQLRRFGAEAQPENVQISLGELFSAMSEMCDESCLNRFRSVIQPNNLWGSSYNEQRLNLNTSPFSAQKLLKILVRRGRIREEEALNLLRSNYMEDILP